MPLTAGVENVQDLGEKFLCRNFAISLCDSLRKFHRLLKMIEFSADDQSRAALVQQLADSIRTLRRVREAEQTAATEEEKKQ